MTSRGLRVDIVPARRMFVVWGARLSFSCDGCAWKLAQHFINMVEIAIFYS